MKASIAKQLSLVWQNPASRLNSSAELNAANLASLQIWTWNDFRERAVFEKVTSQRTFHCGLFFPPLYFFLFSPPFYGVWRLVLQRNNAGTERSWKHGVHAANDRLRERWLQRPHVRNKKAVTPGSVMKVIAMCILQLSHLPVYMKATLVHKKKRSVLLWSSTPSAPCWNFFGCVFQYTPR